MNCKKAVRLAGETPRCADCGDEFAGGVFAQYCARCRPLHQGRPAKRYKLDGATIEILRGRYDTRVRGRVRELAATLGWPHWVVKRFAKQLGLAHPVLNRKPWTDADRAVLRDWEGMRSAGWLGRRLGRSETAVASEMKRLALRRRVREGYAIRDVCLCFGVDHHQVDRWIRRGWLRTTVEGSNGPCTRFSEQHLLQFIHAHPMEFRLDKVNQTWFVGLVFGPNQPPDSPRFIRPAKDIALQNFPATTEAAL